MAAAIRVQYCFERKSLFRPATSMGLDELEFANLAHCKQSPDFLNVLSGMLIKPRQDLWIAGVRECGDLCQHSIAKLAAHGGHAVFERRSGVRNDAGLHELSQNLPKGTIVWSH